MVPMDTVPTIYYYPVACLAAAILLMTLATTIQLVAYGYWTWDMYASYWAMRSFV